MSFELTIDRIEKTKGGYLCPIPEGAKPTAV